MDDAVEVHKTANGYQLTVHIADVASYIQPGSSLDTLAFERATSHYLPNLTIPMLPAILSNDLCSLNPLVRRNTLSVVMEIDHLGNVIQSKIVKGVIGSIPLLPDVGDDNANTYLSGTTNLRRFFQMIMEHHFGKFPELHPNVYRKKCWICGSEDIIVSYLSTAGGFTKYHMECCNPECRQFWVENHCRDPYCGRELGKHFKNYYPMAKGTSWLVFCPNCGR